MFIHQTGLPNDRVATCAQEIIARMLIASDNLHAAYGLSDRTCSSFKIKLAGSPQDNNKHRFERLRFQTPARRSPVARHAPQRCPPDWNLWLSMTAGVFAMKLNNRAKWPTNSFHTPRTFTNA